MKNSTIFYLIGDGYLGSSIKNLLIKNGFTVILGQKNQLLSKSFFNKFNKNIVILYFAAPNQMSKIKVKNIINEYEKINDYLSQFYNDNYKMIFANSSLVYLKEVNKLSLFDLNFIKANEILLKNPLIYNLMIPYVYDELMKKDSLYKKIKNNQLYKKDLKFLDNIIHVQNKKIWRTQAFEKIKNILNNNSPRIIDFSWIELTISKFYDLIKKGVLK